MLDGLDGITRVTIGKGLGWSKEALGNFSGGREESTDG
jgi:hypothetical protein